MRTSTRLLQWALCLAIGCAERGGPDPAQSRREPQPSPTSGVRAPSVAGATSLEVHEAERPNAGSSYQLTAPVTLALLRALPAQTNAVFSPSNIAAALAIVARAGAVGTEAVKLAGIVEAGAPHAPSSGAVLHQAEQLFVSNKRAVRADAAARVGSFEALDFSDGELARARINTFISDHTAHRIDALLPPSSLATDTELVLASALYFAAEWVEPFEPQATLSRPFWVRGLTPIDVPTMRTTRRLAVERRPGAVVLELPCRGDFVVTIALPTTRRGVDALVAALTPETLPHFVAPTTVETVELALPKLRLSSARLDLRRGLSAAGAGALLASADLSGLYADPVTARLDDAVHSAQLELDERGAEGAAATALAFGRSRGPHDVHRIAVDHPFLLFVRQRSTGSLVFVGRVVDPRS